MTTRGRRPVVEELGAVVERLGVLIAAGVSPAHAWGYVAEGSPKSGHGEVVAAVAALAAHGTPVADAVERGALDARTLGPQLRRAWSVLGVAWLVASEAGAPVARCLGDIAASLRASGQVERDTAAALAAPAATTRLVTALPVVSIGASWLMGFDTVRILFTTPLGLACLVSGAVLVLGGRTWSRWMLQRARRLETAPGLSLDLVAIAVAGGGSTTWATALVRNALQRFGLESPHDQVAVDAVLSLAARAGAPPAELLRNEAGRVRRDAIGRATEQAAALGVWLMLPLGVCILPAFMLLAVGPVLIGVLASVRGP
jgi:tight adherence protein B